MSDELNLWCVVYYKDGYRVSRMTLYGIYTDLEEAKKQQSKLCGGHPEPNVNGCVRGKFNQIISWISVVPANQPIQWTLVPAGVGH